MKRFKIFFIILFVIALSLFQISFVSNLPFPLRELDLVIVFLVFLRALSDKEGYIWIFFLAGFIFDIFYLGPLDIFILVLPLTYVFCGFLFNNLFTNRSLFSFLANGLLTTFFFIFLSSSVFYVFRAFVFGANIFLFSGGFWLSLAGKIFFNLLSISIFFFIFNFLSKRLRPVFIIKR